MQRVRVGLSYYSVFQTYRWSESFISLVAYSIFGFYPICAWTSGSLSNCVPLLSFGLGVVRVGVADWHDVNIGGKQAGQL